jgi:diaminohydroxyphosphoribosylaminopyrimidine deaminase/5-amino-6-(5-phosphoribosylamino)uracil reductase
MIEEPEKMHVHMEHAIRIAKKAWGQTHSNPMVGAVIVEAGKIVSEGYHERSGGKHAEIIALESYKGTPQADTTLLITLEPCSTEGRTGACTNAIIHSGIKNVVIGTLDPNPKHSGGGVRLLESAGISVTVGVLEEACREMNIIFNHWIVHKRPLCGLKIAMTLDGCMAASTGHSKWITGELAREDVMHWRRLFPAIAVTQNTVSADNPRLTSRLNDEVLCSQRFVFNRELRDLENYKNYQLFSDNFKSKTIVIYGENAAKDRVEALDAMGIQAWKVGESEGKLNIDEFLKRCADNEIPGVYIEPGAQLATYLIANHSVDYIYIYQSPKLLMDQKGHSLGFERFSKLMNESIHLKDLKREQFGEDALIRGYLRK